MNLYLFKEEQLASPWMRLYAPEEERTFYKNVNNLFYKGGKSDLNCFPQGSAN